MSELSAALENAEMRTDSEISRRHVHTAVARKRQDKAIATCRIYHNEKQNTNRRCPNLFHFHHPFNTKRGYVSWPHAKSFHALCMVFSHTFNLRLRGKAKSIHSQMVEARNTFLTAGLCSLAVSYVYLFLTPTTAYLVSFSLQNHSYLPRL